MNILVTGAGGFVGKNLVENLKNVKAGKNLTRPDLFIDDIYEFERSANGTMDLILLKEYCEKADFVFHLAGVNRPERETEFEEGNIGFMETLLKILKGSHRKAPIMFSSSIQAALMGRYEGSAYGRSKLAGEGLLFQYSRETGAEVFIYRFPNLFGKWCRPNYNSAVATFCSAIANHREYTVNDRDTSLELVYIDDLIEEMLDVLEGKEHRCEYEGMHPVENGRGMYCHVPISYTVTLEGILDLLKQYRRLPETRMIPEMPEGSFEKKLYSTYLSYVTKEHVSYPLVMNKDDRGSFTELLKTEKCGQVSVNVVKPGHIRGQHWHNSKWEIFMVVSGHGLIQERKIGKNEDGNPYPVMEFEVNGEDARAVLILPGYTHNIRNLSETRDLVTIMWANEKFDENHPDTFFEPVEIGKEI